MDGFVLGLFLFAAFLGGFASGLAGFAMGFIVAGIWLHIITPIQTTALIAGYGLCTQGYGVWKLRHALNWRNVAPFIVGGRSAFQSARCCCAMPIPPTCAVGSACYWSFTASTA
jgi:uncharacterized membrane protein YfcA